MRLPAYEKTLNYLFKNGKLINAYTHMSNNIFMKIEGNGCGLLLPQTPEFIGF